MRGRANRILLVESRRPGIGEERKGRGVENAATIVAAAVGLVGYLYALGGVMVWLRIQTSELPSEAAAVGASDRHLLELGARAVAFELLLSIVIGVVVATLFSVAVIRRGRLPRHVRTDRARLEDVARSKPILGSIVGLEIPLLLIAIGLGVGEPAWLHAALWILGLILGGLVGAAMIATVKSATGDDDYEGRLRIVLIGLEAPGPKRLRKICAALFVLALFIGIFLVPLLQGTLLIAGTIMIFVGHLTSWPQRNTPGSFPRELLRSTGVWLGVVLATAVALAWVATPPVGFSRVVVKSADGRVLQTGAYLDRDTNGLYIGQCRSSTASAEDRPDSTEATIRLLPPTESGRLELGGEEYSFDPGGRPSLADVVFAGLSGGDAATNDAPLSYPLRGRSSELCGLPPTPPR